MLLKWIIHPWFLPSSVDEVLKLKRSTLILTLIQKQGLSLIKPRLEIKQIYLPV